MTRYVKNHPTNPTRVVTEETCGYACYEGTVKDGVFEGRHVGVVGDPSDADKWLNGEKDVLLHQGAPMKVLDPARTVIIGNHRKLRIGEGSRIDSFVKLEIGRGLYIGPRVHIASFCHIGVGGGFIYIAEGATCSSGVKIVSGSGALDAPSMSAVETPDKQWANRGRVVIGKNAAVLTGAIISPNVRIGEGARIYPGAVVTKDVPPGEHWAGVPARRIK